MPMPMPMPMPNNQSNMNMYNDMAMHMTFFWGKDVVILFAGWPGTGRIGMYLLALAAVFVLAVAVEILSVSPRMKPRSLSPVAGAVINAAVYAVRMALAYLIMLSVMSYNAGVFVVVVAGHAAGRFVVKYRELTAVARAVDF